MTDKRQNPEKFLARAKEEEVQLRGKLKIYLGAAPGVGKTYAMLEDAQARLTQGLDVVAGVVESHGRQEIEDRLKNLAILPRRAVEYHGKSLLEFDLDAALSRNPGLILMDEMAHTNVPGLRHSKRWQDIKELLDCGIDVYTTLNVQHIESLNDVVSHIIGIKVRETVPDSLLEAADTIELVDLPPDDLLKRLQEGKVYIPAQAELAAQNFFRKGNLIALRELALRATAERVDEQVLQHRRGQGIDQTWQTKERLLVCVGASATSSKVIRAAKRMSKSLHADWIVVHVDVPHIHLSTEQRNMVTQNLRLADQLGAETRILSGLDIVTELLDFAHEKNVTKIVIGKHYRPRWKEVLFGNLAEALVRKSGEIDLYIIHGDAEEIKIPTKSPRHTVAWKSYFFAIVAPVIVSVIDILLSPYSGLSNLFLFYLLGVILIAVRGHMGSALLSASLSVLMFDFLFVAGQDQFLLLNFSILFMLLVMLSIAYIISRLTIVNHQQIRITQIDEQRTAALYVLTRQLASTRGTDKLLEIATSYLSKVFHSDVTVLMPLDGQLKIRAASDASKTLTAKDEGVAHWVYDLGQIAGLGTDTLPFSDAIYVPLLGSQGTVGVLKVHPRLTDPLLVPEQLRLLESCANQIALALEVDRLQEKAKGTQIAIETERLRTALFSSLSHELRSPLAAIVRLINNFIKKKTEIVPESTHTLIQNIAHEAESLDRLINSLLQITQLEEGQIQLHKKPHAVDKVVQSSLKRLEKKLGGKPYKTQITPGLPLVSFDAVLIEQVLVNLMENAILYTPAESALDIAATVEDDTVLISVGDRGPGLMAGDIDMIFEKFYRGQTPIKQSGAGLGLTVCQSIIKAHGGRIWAENRGDGGAIFCFVLPIQ
jgi:two-component system sensor histidine kinase KdpD